MGRAGLGPLSIEEMPPASSGFGALHWLHSLRHEKFRLSQFLQRREQKVQEEVKG